MPFGLDDALMVAGALSGAVGGVAAGGASMAGTKEQKRQFNIEEAQKLMRALESQPLRERLLYMLNARAGLAPAPFRPRDMYNPQAGGTGDLGGIDLSAYKRQVEAYQPQQSSASSDLLRKLLEQTGYKQSGTGYEAVGAPPIDYQAMLRGMGRHF